MIKRLLAIIDEIFIQLLIALFKTISKVQALFMAFNYLKIKQIISRFNQ